MTLKTTAFIFSFLFSLQAFAATPYHQSFISKSLSVIPTPSLTCGSVNTASASKFITLASLVQSPASNPWIAAPARPSRRRDGPNWPLILTITGGVILAIGFGFRTAAVSKGQGGIPDASLNLTGLVLMIIGVATAATGSIISFYNREDRKSGGWYGG